MPCLCGRRSFSRLPFVSSSLQMQRQAASIAVTVIIWLQHYSSAVPATPVPKIAVIGGGIGGASAAYFLRTLFGTELGIDLYEKDLIGGRLSLVRVGDYLYEAGGSIIHERNRYMNEFLRKLNLKQSVNPTGRLGLFDGKKFVFEESGYSAVTYLELIWRYGFNLVRWNRLMSEMLDNFDNIYNLQENGYAYKTVESLLEAMAPEFVNMTQITMGELLKQKGFTDVFIKELALAASRVNYGQSLYVNGFVGAVSLAAAQSKLWSVCGGNKQLVQGALNISNVNIIHTAASKVTLTDDKKFLVSTNELDELANEVETFREYNMVIVAAPQTNDLASLIFKGFPQQIGPFPGNYHRTVATFVQGIINAAHFGYSKPSDAVDDVLTINMNLVYNSVSRNYPVNEQQKTANIPKVYKVFSQRILTTDELDELFLEREVTQVVDWLAYPHYLPPEKLGDFKLHDFLYYTSPIEWASSAMEMSAIAAHNVALLAFNDWNNKAEKIDNTIYEKPINVEL